MMAHHLFGSREITTTTVGALDPRLRRERAPQNLRGLETRPNQVIEQKHQHIRKIMNDTDAGCGMEWTGVCVCVRFSSEGMVRDDNITGGLQTHKLKVVCAASHEFQQLACPCAIRPVIAAKNLRRGTICQLWALHPPHHYDRHSPSYSAEMNLLFTINVKLLEHPSGPSHLPFVIGLVSLQLLHLVNQLAKEAVWQAAKADRSHGRGTTQQSFDHGQGADSGGTHVHTAASPKCRLAKTDSQLYARRREQNTFFHHNILGNTKSYWVLMNLERHQACTQLKLAKICPSNSA